MHSRSPRSQPMTPLVVDSCDTLHAHHLTTPSRFYLDMANCPLRVNRFSTSNHLVPHISTRTMQLNAATWVTLKSHRNVLQSETFV